MSSLCRLKENNPEWNPAHFTVDKSDAEANAIKAVFPECKILLCDFHRLQAKQRWPSKSKHDVPSCQ